MTLQIDSAIAPGGGFYLDKTNTTINLGNTLSILNSTVEAVVETKHLTIAGKGEAHFNEMYLDHKEGVAVHDLSDSVYVEVNQLIVESPSTVMQIDDASSLEVHQMYAGDSGTDQNFLHAFQNDGSSSGDRNYITVDELYVGNGTARLGAASTTQGAGEGYQEAGTIKVGYIQGSGTVVLENNAEVKHEGQSLTEVFDIEKASTGDHAFTGTLRLAATNNGTETQRKEAVAVFRSVYTAYNTNALELQADADYTDYAFVLNNQFGLSTNGIQDVPGHGVKSNSTAMIYSGTIGDEKNANIDIDGQRRTLEMFADNGTDYRSSFGISKNIDVKLTGNGKQTFTGDFSAFNGDIWIGGGSTSGTLSILEQATAVTIEDLTIRQEAVLNVKGAENANQLAKVSGTLTAQGYGAYEGEDYGSSVVNANLQMEQGSVYDVSAAFGSGGLNLNGSLTFAQGALLSDNDMAKINGMAIGDMYDLAFDVTSLNDISGVIDWIGDDAIDASTIFGQDQFYQGEFYLCYSGNGTAGGYGNNVGTVYLYRALPEPTTGTLSLLALAALAARRRRK